MSKKQVMKEIFEEKINKDKIYQKVLLKVEEKGNMEKVISRKIIYGLSSCVAVFILGFGIIVATNYNSDVKKPNYEIGDLREEKQNLKVTLQINRIGQMASKKIDGKIESILDADVENIDLEKINVEKLPEQLSSLKNIDIPQGFKLNSMYKLYVRSNIEIKKYDLLHDYVISYIKDKEHDIRIASSTIGRPLRDYGISEEDKTSKIGDIELKIYQYEKMYLAEFKVKNMYFDIETNGITENELVELLESIINGVSHSNMNSEEKDTNVKEQANENTDGKYPEYYAGKYVDDNGNNVVLLCENNIANRKDICNKLGIAESKTIFKVAKYSYNYLTELQNKISQKMIEKEVTFVTSSAVMEDTNNIKVIVTSNNENDLNKIKVLDTIGGAIYIEYNINAGTKQDLSIEKE